MLELLRERAERARERARGQRGASRSMLGGTLGSSASNSSAPSPSRARRRRLVELGALSSRPQNGFFTSSSPDHAPRPPSFAIGGALSNCTLAGALARGATAEKFTAGGRSAPRNEAFVLAGGEGESVSAS